MKVILITHTPEPEKVIAASAKLCYSKSNIENLLDNLSEETSKEFLDKLPQAHTSPFEHVTFTFGIEGVSRTFLAQITRHRIASYSVQSQRYVNLKDTFEYIIPPEIQDDEECLKIFNETIAREKWAYNTLSNKLKDKYIINGMSEIQAEKKAIEDARFVLPNASETKMIVTMNIRSLYNFFALRCCNNAQWEIRNVANEMLKICKEVSPTLFKNAGANCVRGKCPEGNKSCGKVKGVD